MISIQNYSLELQTSSSSITKQFEIDSNENIYTVVSFHQYFISLAYIFFLLQSTEPIENNSHVLASKSPGKESTTSKKHLHHTLSKSFPVKTSVDSPKEFYLRLLFQCDKQNTDQSVQTDLSIPLCCRIHQNGHSFYSTCKHYVRTKGNL